MGAHSNKNPNGRHESMAYGLFRQATATWTYRLKMSIALSPRKSVSESESWRKTILVPGEVIDGASSSMRASPWR